MSPKKETMTSSLTPFILVVLSTVVTSTAGNNVDIAAIRAAGAAAAKSSQQLREAVDRQVDRRKRSGAFEESAVGSDRFVPPADERTAPEDLATWNGEVDELGSRLPVKRGRWAKNNVQMWGKRSSSWPSAEGDVTNAGLRLRSPSARSFGSAGVDGTWSKRKKTWEKNNFKMWGKRSAVEPDNEQDVADRFLPLIARVLEERRLSRPVYSDVGVDDEQEEQRGGGRVPAVELELPPSSSSLLSGNGGPMERPAPYAIDWRTVAQRPKKKVGWSSNNVHMWG